jgi:ubiquitin carboxyl-terminal hydrolase 8
MNREKYKDKGLSGLENLGNTCYINSCLQVISHMYELNHLFDDEIIQKKIQKKYDSVVFIEWNNLRKIMWNDNCVISPKQFIKTITLVAKLKGFETFVENSQNDISEFLLFLIECFHEALSREITMQILGTPENETDNVAVECFEMVKKMNSTKYSEIWNLFYAVQISEIYNMSTGEKVKIIPEQYFILNLSIPQHNKSPSLNDCLNYYIEDEIFEGNNNWLNEETKERINIKKKIQFWSFPTILVIDFKRFNLNFQKNHILVTFPLENLDLSKYVVGYSKNNCKYDLFGVCNHSGGVMGGHYTSYVKNANGKWYHFNDTQVSEVNVPETIITPKAYVLFYRKII